MRRHILISVCAVALVAVAPAAASTPSPPGQGAPSGKPASKPAPKQRSWADTQIRLVVSHGLMARDVASFRPDDPLTRGALADLVAGLTGRLPAPVVNPSAPVTMAGLDTNLARGLGRAVAAGHFARAARAAGLSPPARFGSEVTARM